MATGGLRFAGEEAVFTCLDTTTGDQMLSDMNIESVSVNVVMELTKKEFMGEIGPNFREFYDGWEAELKFEPNDPAQMVAYANAIIAKSQGLSNDEFAISMKFVSPDRGAFRVTLRDAHFEGLPMDLASRTDFLTGTVKVKGNICKFQTV